MPMLQFIVLLAIMALWALTSLLSREAQPLPPATERGPGPDGHAAGSAHRPGRAGRARRDTAGPPTTRRRRRSSARPRLAGPSRRRRPGPAPAGPGVDDGIVILESDARRSRPPAGRALAVVRGGTPQPRGGQSRRGSRGRPSTGATPDQAGRAGPAARSPALVTQSMAQKKTGPSRSRRWPPRWHRSIRP